VFSRPRLTFAGLIAATVLLGLTGCTGLDEASAASITRDDLVSEMAGQLAGAAQLTYTATYQLAGGDTARIIQAQAPTRTAYSYPGGSLLVTPTATVRCVDKSATCTETTPEPTADAALTGTMMVTPDAVLSMLNIAALDPDVISEQHDTTIAGRHATCLNLRQVDGTPARDFSVCVTSEGALGSFTATVKGETADQALTAYSDKAAPSAFTIPTSRKLLDKRPK
jgi:hypothetical protein